MTLLPWYLCSLVVVSLAAEQLACALKQYKNRVKHVKLGVLSQAKLSGRI